MGDGLEAIGLVVIIVVAVVFLFALLGTLLGCFTGWVIHCTPLRHIVENGFQAFHVNASGQLVNIGGAVGFVSGLFGGMSFSKSNNNK